MAGSEIANVPAGKHDFAFWHEAKGNLKDLKVSENKADRKGQLQYRSPRRARRSISA